MITAFPPVGPSVPVPVPVSSLPEGLYLCWATQGSSEGPVRVMCLVEGGEGAVALRGLSFCPLKHLCPLPSVPASGSPLLTGSPPPHFWPSNSGNPGFSQGEPRSWHWVRGMDDMMADPQDLGPQHGAGKPPRQPGIGGEIHLVQEKEGPSQNKGGKLCPRREAGRPVSA